MKRQKLNRLLELIGLGEWKHQIRLHKNLEKIRNGKTWLRKFVDKKDKDGKVEYLLGCTDIDLDERETEDIIWVREKAYRGERVHVFIPRHSNQLDEAIKHYGLESSRRRIRNFTSKLTPKEMHVLLTTLHELCHVMGYENDKVADSFAREKFFELLEYYGF
jgi:hypothetical protein